MRVDPREIYLKRLLTLDRSTNRSFRDFYHLALLFLQDPDREGESEEVLAVEEEMKHFLHRFKSEKGTPGLEYVLWELDVMRLTGKKYLKVKTRQTRKKWTYPEIIFQLQELEDFMMFLVRMKAKHIRILNPEVSI